MTCVCRFTLHPFENLKVPFTGNKPRGVVTASRAALHHTDPKTFFLMTFPFYPIGRLTELCWVLLLEEEEDKP